jgi:hypothetical protein
MPGQEEEAMETLYCFLDPSSQRRQAVLITDVGFRCSVDEMPHRWWAGKGKLVAYARMLERSATTNHQVLDPRHAVKLVSLDDFVKRKQGGHSVGNHKATPQRITRVPSGRKKSPSSSFEGSSDGGESRQSESNAKAGDTVPSHASSDVSEAETDTEVTVAALDAASFAPPNPKKARTCGAPSVISRSSCGVVASTTASDVGIEMLTAEAQVAAKRAKLPLADAMIGEPKGGWGRSVRGAERVRCSLAQNADTMADASALQHHLDLFALARTLQPTNVMSLDDGQLSIARPFLQKVGVVAPTCFQCAVSTRRV